ncbi:MAG: hypothetical protein ABIM74_03110 [candidate division WOR-3 bacterium]
MRLLLVGIGLSFVFAHPIGATTNITEDNDTSAPVLGKAFPIKISVPEVMSSSEVRSEATGGLLPSFAVACAPSPPRGLPFYDGGGWLSPIPISPADDNERVPSVAVDASGNIWVALLVDEESNSHIRIFRSTDRGLTWALVLGIYNSYGGPVGPPQMFIDPGPTPNIVYLAFASYWKDGKGLGHRGLEVASFASDRPSETFQSTWVSAEPDFDVSEIALSVERGRGSENKAFIPARATNRLSGIQYLWVFRGSRYAPWAKVLSVGGDRCYRGGPEIWSTDRATYLVFKANAENSLPEEAQRVHIFSTLNHGASWRAIYADIPYPVSELSVAGAQGRNEAVAFVALKYGRSDHDVYAFYTKDLGATWGGYWMETGNEETRSPRVSPDGVQFDAGQSNVFYFTEYCDRENDSLGNIKFLMCPAEGVDKRSSWCLPDGLSLDSLVISNELLYGVEPAEGCLSLSSRSELSGSMPVVVWNTPYISHNSDVFFARPIAPVYVGAQEEDGVGGGLRVLFIPSLNAIRIEGEPPEGSYLHLYSVDGREVWTFGPLPRGKTTTMRLPYLPEGVYLWRLLGTGGRVSVIR